MSSREPSLRRLGVAGGANNLFEALAGRQLPDPYAEVDLPEMSMDEFLAYGGMVNPLGGLFGKIGNVFGRKTPTANFLEALAKREAAAEEALHAADPEFAKLLNAVPGAKVGGTFDEGLNLFKSISTQQLWAKHSLRELTNALRDPSTVENPILRRHAEVDKEFGRTNLARRAKHVIADRASQTKIAKMDQLYNERKGVIDKLYEHSLHPRVREGYRQEVAKIDDQMAMLLDKGIVVPEKFRGAEGVKSRIQYLEKLMNYVKGLQKFRASEYAKGEGQPPSIYDSQIQGYVDRIKDLREKGTQSAHYIAPGR